MDYSPGVLRRDFLGGITAAVPLVSGTSTAARESVSSEVVQREPGGNADDALDEAIRTAQSYLFDNRRGTNQLGGRTYRHWETATIGLNEYGKYRQTITYALLLERMGKREADKELCISYILDNRNEGGGWNDAASNFGALLLFEKLDGDYEEIRADIQSEIDEKGQILVPELNEDGNSVKEEDQDRTGGTDLTYEMRIIYAAMSDEYTYEDLFPRDGPFQIARALSLTEAFEGKTVSANEHMVRQSFVTILSAGYLIATESYTKPLDERERELKEILTRVMISRRLSSGVWGSTLPSLLALMAILETETDLVDDEAIYYPLEWISRNRLTDEGRLEPWNTPIWDTSKAIQALRKTGIEPDDPRLREAAQWLFQARTPTTDSKPIQARLDRPMAKYRNHHGDGWGYRENIYSDWDDTAIALETLADFMGPHLEEDAEFLIEVQNSDGSWSAFAKDFAPFDDEEAERIKAEMNDGMYRRFFGRNRSPDITGGSLSALGKLGYTIDNSQSVRDAVEWLKEARADNGMWVAIWGEAFTYGAARILRGLREVEVDMDRKLVQRVAQGLIERQNDDGGWGEDSSWDATKSNPWNVPYVNAESTPEQTGWALQGILAAGISPDHPAVQRGVDYLLDTQQSDGSWPASMVMYNWGGASYSSGATTQGAVLKALGMFRKARKSE